MGPGVGIPSVHGGAWVNLTTVHGEDGRGRVREMGEGGEEEGVALEERILWRVWRSAFVGFELNFVCLGGP